MNIDKYKSVASWYHGMKNEGYEVPLALFHMLNKMINERNITFHQAYDVLTAEEKIEINDKKINFHLNRK